MSDYFAEDDTWFKPRTTPSDDAIQEVFPADATMLEGCKRVRAALCGKRDGKVIQIPAMDMKIFVEGGSIKVGFVDKAGKRSGYAYLNTALSLERALEEVLELCQVNWMPWPGKK